ncbi:Uncharacterised protein [Actinomyces howellii]|uniref:Uncharacterized protein n=1 Tax=Actinomyces howellii TaxID=52771 RepID=A0A448HFI0_9ACTO|nr:Uncharacterised protein [Actinomyces howellii]
MKRNIGALAVAVAQAIQQSAGCASMKRNPRRGCNSETLKASRT